MDPANPFCQLCVSALSELYSISWVFPIIIIQICKSGQTTDLAFPEGCSLSVRFQSLVTFLQLKQALACQTRYLTQTSCIYTFVCVHIILTVIFINNFAKFPILE